MLSFEWLRKKLRKKEENWTEFIKNNKLIPFLPRRRPSILTPSTSSEHLVSFDSYGLFQRLPYETRRLILIEAFGGRTLHMDLDFAYPPKRKSGPQTNLTTDTDTMNWQWLGCVCHRPVEWPECSNFGSLFGRPYSMRECEWIRKTRPCGDRCRPMQRVDRSSECFIGIMGWLLACRQAYADGIDVLFATNTFHLNSPILLKHLHRMVLPQRLRAIPSLEICWLEKSVNSRVRALWDDPTTGNSELHALCRMVPQVFPHVLHLDIALLCDIRPFGDGVPNPTEKTTDLYALAMEHTILRPVESMLRSLGPGREFTITVPMLDWCILEYRYRVLYGPKRRIESYSYGSKGRFWKVLDPGTGPGTELGYWISCGKYEYPMTIRYQNGPMGLDDMNARIAHIAQIAEDEQNA